MAPLLHHLLCLFQANREHEDEFQDYDSSVYDYRASIPVIPCQNSVTWMPPNPPREFNLTLQSTADWRFQKLNMQVPWPSKGIFLLHLHHSMVYQATTSFPCTLSKSSRPPSLNLDFADPSKTLDCVVRPTDPKSVSYSASRGSDPLGTVSAQQIHYPRGVCPLSK